MSVRLAILAAGLAAVLLSGCGGSAGSSTGSGQALTLLPSADPFTSAIVATKSLGTASLVVDVAHPQASRSAHGEGVTVLGSGQGDVTWSVGGDAYRELSNGRGVYVQRPPQSGGWEQWPSDHITATSGYIDSLRGLGVLHDVTNEGPEQLGDVATTRYRGWLPLTPDEAGRLGLSGPPAADAREQVTVWIDGFGHAVRVDRQAATPSDSVSSTTAFTDFSVLLNLSSPSQGVTATRR